MALMRWNPVAELNRMREEMDRMMERFFGPPERELPAVMAWSPSVDVYEQDGNVVVEAELPGVKRENVDVSIQDNSLIISGEMKREEEKKEEGYYRRERHYGRFMRSVPLPVPVTPEQAQAKFQEGVLRVTLPEAKEEAKGQKIPIQ